MASAMGVVRAVRRKVYGLVFLAIIAALIAFTIGLYNKALPWQASDTVYLEADRIGNQLNLGGDVKVRGVFVGNIRSIEVESDSSKCQTATNGNGCAVIKMSLDRDQIDRIPSNVTARIVPKTLFGEKFVNLIIPENPSSEPLEDGDVIGQDRSEVAIETGKVFDDILPLLRTLQPVKLNATLNALATALEGRGNALGENFVLADQYFRDFNPHLDTLNQDISGLADLADSLGDAAPDLLRLAANSASSLQEVVVAREDTFSEFLRGTQGFATTLTRVLRENENSFIELADNSRKILGVLEHYSPEYPCLLRGLTDIQERVEATFATGPYLYVHLEVLPLQSKRYFPGADDPSYSQYGPANCNGLPQPGDNNPNYPHPGVSSAEVAANAAAVRQRAYGDIGAIGSQNEIDVINALAGSLMDRPADEVASITALLLGPLVRGMEVDLR